MTILTNTYSASSANAAYASSTQSSNGSHPTFSEEMYSDPEMRPYLEQYYEKAYAPMRERIAAMREDGYTPKTIQTEDGGVAQEISADQYEAMIPDFDKWLEGQKTIIPGLHDSVDIFREGAQRHVDYLEKHHPDSQSDVRAVFSNGDQILGYLYENGGMVTHDRGSHLRTYSDQADKLGLRGQARVDYIADAVSRDYSSIDVSRYDDQNAPTRREFSERWYPDHDVDQGYQANLQEARSQLAAAEERYRQQQSNITEMHGYLLGLMEQEQQA
ncbi:hypothetical protein ACFOY8_16010 [Thalassospira xianhensis]|uniref:Uncharacterized protein n=1 Tax=Thalassospira xianhensis MCCC 1A02616 TaxID=1177929 RepID=A0A367U7A3_9PROT|nr:hypothetical protein [Thalassospira xianhensis]RCK04177.1 hypothetical protein TH5_21105 [Thalassospira xianhensis MCCC 1A02616]